MSYTNVDLIRSHIEYSQPMTDYILDQLLICDTVAYMKIFNGPILDNSVIVKTITNYLPTTKLFSVSETSFTIHTTPIVRGSLVCASDSSLGEIYKENIDFVID